MLQFHIYDGDEVKVRIELFIEKKDGILLKVMWNDPLFIKVMTVIIITILIN